MLTGYHFRNGDRRVAAQLAWHGQYPYVTLEIVICAHGDVLSQSSAARRSIKASSWASCISRYRAQGATS